MTPKQKIIKIFESVKKDYGFEIMEKDKICNVIKELYGDGCDGCPLSYRGKKCSSMKTYPANNGNTLKSFTMREKFFKETIKILESLPDESFKKEKEFGVLFDLDEEIYNKK